MPSCRACVAATSVSMWAVLKLANKSLMPLDVFARVTGANLLLRKGRCTALAVVLIVGLADGEEVCAHLGALNVGAAARAVGDVVHARTAPPRVGGRGTRTSYRRGVKPALHTHAPPARRPLRCQGTRTDGPSSRRRGHRDALGRSANRQWGCT